MTNKEKQIEEMSQITHDGCAIVKATNQCRGDDCLDCAAVTLYEKGYRKASDVAREIFEEIDRMIYKVLNDRHYIMGDMCYEVAELKNKYTEEGK